MHFFQILKCTWIIEYQNILYFVCNYIKIISVFYRYLDKSKSYFVSRFSSILPLRKVFKLSRNFVHANKDWELVQFWCQAFLKFFLSLNFFHRSKVRRIRHERYVRYFDIWFLLAYLMEWKEENKRASYFQILILFGTAKDYSQWQTLGCNGVNSLSVNLQTIPCQ